MATVGRWDGIPGKVGGSKITKIVLKNNFISVHCSYDTKIS